MSNHDRLVARVLLSCLLFVSLTAGLSGCKKSEEKQSKTAPGSTDGSTRAPASPKGDDPRRTGPSSDLTKPQVTLRPGGPDDPGGTQVLVDGKAVWPPSGPGCEALVSCCRAAAAVERAFGLACQLGLAQRRSSCGDAQVVLKRIIQERGATVPAACNTP
jgi:hypothetical protein